jgi:hypothetical protein
MSLFKEEIKTSLNNELEADQFVMNIIERFKQAIRNSIVNPGVEEAVIFKISETPLTDNQVAQVSMACVKHIGVEVTVTEWEIVVFMKLFLL